MLTELAPDLLGAVYDRLLIEDRVSLNRALPKASRVVRPIDRALHAVRSVVKRRPGVVLHARKGALRRFLDANRGDPTVEQLLADAAPASIPSISSLTASYPVAGEAVAVEEIVNELVELLGTGDIEKLLLFDRSSMFTAYARNFASSSVPDATLRLADKCLHMRQLLSSLNFQHSGRGELKVPTVRILGAIEASPLLSALFAKILSDEFNAQGFMFNLLNYEKFDVIRHVLGRPSIAREQYGVTPAVTAYMVGKFTADMCGSRGVDVVRFYLDVFKDAITEATVDFLSSSALVNLNMPVLSLLAEKVIS